MSGYFQRKGDQALRIGRAGKSGQNLDIKAHTRTGGGPRKRISSENGDRKKRKRKAWNKHISSEANGRSKPRHQHQCVQVGDRQNSRKMHATKM